MLYRQVVLYILEDLLLTNEKQQQLLLQTVRNEGFLALYKGFIPTWVRMGPWNIIFFITYEQLKKY